MLKLDFINVGDGDAILIRETGPGEADYVMLVDCGRPHIEFVPGSKRRHALNYLMREGIGRIDLMFSNIDQNISGLEFPSHNFVFGESFKTLLRMSGIQIPD